VLLVVGPAEASVPRSAGVAQVDADALASLERPALGLASPTLEPSGFSLGEDLSVFDATNAQGSLGLCGLETRRCALTYARNNPLRFVDPDGREEMDAVLMSTQRMQLREMGGEAAVSRFDRTFAAMGGAFVSALAGGAALAHFGLAGLFVAATDAVHAPLAVGAAATAVAAAGGDAGAVPSLAPRILERDGSVVRMAANGAKGVIEIVTEMTKKDGVLTLRGTHVEGLGKGSSGLRELREIARQLGKSEGVDRVVIEGARRTSGAKPGHVPIPITVRVE
jgi:hypothetical protein